MLVFASFDLEELDELLDLLFLSGILNPRSIPFSGILTFSCDLEELDELLDWLFLSFVSNPKSIFYSGMLTFSCDYFISNWGPLISTLFELEDEELLFLSGILNPNSIPFSSFDLEELDELSDYELLFLSFVSNPKFIFLSGMFTFASFDLEELDELLF